jgi:purine-binding chemotaxis protein CheW
MEKQYVSFDVIGNRYCIDIMDIKEVVRENEVTRLPDSPSFVEGIMNLRGIVIPVISLKKKLGLSAADEKAGKSSGQNKMIIISMEGVLIGLMVDTLDRVFSVDTDQIQSAEKFADTGIDRALIQGVVKMDEQLYLLLDIKKILDLEEKKFIQQQIVE